MAANIVGAFEPTTQNVVKNSKVLLVGAGGIGCEVLKILVLMGFGDLEVIDLDTIEVSNLNRQFLFNKESVGKPKSSVAKESVLRFNPNVNINSHYGDIMDKKYGPAFFNKFKLVINALDNKKARSHVNRMCLSCDIPLIESGTMGYHGQVELIKKNVTLCYECTPKPETKEYPMCTIRNTPKESIHCVIWSKYLFGQLFGEVSDEIVSMDENNENVRLSARDWAKLHNFDGRKLLKKIFFDDIDYLLSMPDLYNSKIIKPVKLDTIYLIEVKSEYKNEPENKVLLLSQYIAMFVDSLAAIKTKLLNSSGCLIWDKDDDDFMNFVVSCTNLRSTIFNIPMKSHFEIKSMAGNIIPAIPTANAIIGGQIVILALRVLCGKFSQCQSVYLRNMPNHKGELIVKDKKVMKPNPKCYTCSTAEGEMYLYVDFHKFTLRQFEDQVLRLKLNLIAPEVMNEVGRMIISCDAIDNLNLYSKTLYQADVVDGGRLKIEDDVQNFKVFMVVRHKIHSGEEDSLYELFTDINDLDKNDHSGGPLIEEYNDDLLYDENKPIQIISVQSLAVKEEDLSDVEAEMEEAEMEEPELEEPELEEPESSDEIDMETGIERGAIRVAKEQNDVALSINEDNSVNVTAENQRDSNEGRVPKTDNNETREDYNNEQLLALKRKAEDDEVSDTKKSRQSTDE